MILIRQTDRGLESEVLCWNIENDINRWMLYNSPREYSIYKKCIGKSETHGKNANERTLIQAHKKKSEKGKSFPRDLHHVRMRRSTIELPLKTVKPMYSTLALSSSAAKLEPKLSRIQLLFQLINTSH